MTYANKSSVNAYRTLAEVAAEIPDHPKKRKMQTRVLVAATIVAPVRLIKRFSTWFLCNATYQLCCIGVYAVGFWKEPLLLALVGNTFALVVYGFYRAYRWAVHTLNNADL